MQKIFDSMSEILHIMSNRANHEGYTVMPISRGSRPLAIAVSIAVALSASQAALGAEPPAAPPGSATVSLQGGDQRAMINNPQAHEFYGLTVMAFAHGAAKVDFPEYQKRSYAIFRAMGAAMGMAPEKMQDHLKDIPRQLVQIVAEDPKALDSWDSFTLALVGPP
jgi:hypothetical protein